MIQDAWVQRAIDAPIHKTFQADGWIRRWCQVITVEHASTRADAPKFSYEQIAA